MMNKLIIVVCFLCFITPSVSQAQEPFGSLSSPDGELTVRLFQQNDITFYDIQRAGKMVLEASELGVQRSDADLYKKWKLIESAEARTKTENYTLTVGKQRTISKTYRERKWIFSDDNYNGIEIIFRVFDDGVAFRYHFSYLDNNKETVFTDEYTTFNLPENGVAWLQPYDSVTKFSPAYERYFDNAVPIAPKSNRTEGWVFPALFHAHENWTLITESDLGKTYCGMHLQTSAEKGIYRLRFPEKTEGMEDKRQLPTTNAVEWFSPWRVVITGKNLGDVITSTLATDVARPASKQDFSWVKPGRASWSWCLRWPWCQYPFWP